MPTYHYRCRNCSTELEVRQSFSEDPLTDCPEGCGAGTLRKVFSGVGISFKGSGFYKNDHGSSASERKSSDRADSTASSKESTGGKAPSTTGSSKTAGSD